MTTVLPELRGLSAELVLHGELGVEGVRPHFPHIRLTLVKPKSGRVLQPSWLLMS
jgi:hypothetical protein